MASTRPGGIFKAMTLDRPSQPGQRTSMLGWLPGESLRRAQLAERVEWELQSDLVNRLVREKPFAEIAHIVLAGVMCLIVWDDLGSALAASWLGLVTIAALMRWRVRLQLRRRGGPLEQQLRHIRISVGVLALAWGIGGVLAAPLMPATHTLLVMVIFSGLAAVAPLSLVADPKAFWILITGLLGSLAIILLRAPLDEVRIAALVIEVLYAASLVPFYQRSHDQLVEALRTGKRFEFSEQEVARERAFLDALITSAPTAIAAVSRHGRVLGVNPAFEQTFGHTNDAVVGQDLDALLVPEEGLAEARALGERVANGESISTEVERLRADGTRLWVRVSAAPVQGIAQGGVFVVYEDITAIRRAEQARREVESQYRRLVDAASDMVFEVDREGRWTFLNEAAGRIYDCDPESMLGKPFVEFVHPDHLTRDREAFGHVLEGDELMDYETVHVDALGKPHVMSFSAIPLCGLGGESLGAYGIARDVTDRAEAREALRAARDEAERATRMKSAFLANMSHEIRTPLNGVLGMIQLLLDSKLNKDQRRQAELIQGSAETLLRVINDVLDFSKIEAGRVDLEEAVFNPGALVEDLAQLYGPRASAKGIQLIADVDRSVPNALRSDAVRLRQVLSNLLSNALKFTERGQVTMSLRLVGTGDGAATVRFAVRDTGIGIPEQAQARIFDEFEQADVSTSRKYGGTGLGLAISRQLVRILGGILEVRSAEGDGAEFFFTLTLPLGAEPPAAATASVPVRGDGAGRQRILVAEDNPVNQEVARQMLQRRGHEVVVVENGHEAVERVRTDPAFDIVLMDVQMPVMDGLTATAAIRALGVPGQVPIYAVTANASGVERDRCMAAGMDGYLTKPFRPEDLFRLVEHRIDGTGAGPTPRRATPPVDLEEFRAQLAEAGVASALDDMLQLFVTDAPARFQALEDALAERDAERIRSAAHAYKSSAGTIWATRLAEVLRDIERAADEQDVARTAALAADARRTHDETMAYLQGVVRA